MPNILTHTTSWLTGAGVAAAGLLAGSLALAQPLVLRVNPQLADRGVLMNGNEPGSVQTLFDSGPRYNEPSGVRVGRGSVIPGWLQIGSFQNVSLGGLNPTGYYGYYISPDDRAVLIDLDSRRVVRVIPR
ncbi:hypothetical protein J2X36_000794 [Methylobacterium sp. BE186]|uniref:hypothetical protein n=1 Tax=Methylobacterium sp. BE186 TaxID=2817715 RepID=UPI00285DE1A4|nr:hypothetical protein [Methylobacterium sp. BE186]MDR7036058.1 hypothetical protein [Methylobacterium sp. BE186]